MADDRSKIREDVLKNAKHVLITIQVLMLQGKPIFDAYKDFCKILGDDVMEYNDFDFWWFRFLNGEFDLDYDRSKEKKKRELGDMPPFIVEKIVKNLGCDDRYPLQKVSKAISNIMEDSNLLISQLSMNFTHNKISLKFNERYAEFVKGRRTKVISGGVEKFVRGGHITVAMKNLARFLKNPKLRFSDFSVGFNKGRSAKNNEMMKYSKAVRNVLDSTPHRIHVNKLEMVIVADTQLMEIIPYLKPGVLQFIQIRAGEATDAGIKDFVESDQFKQAQSFWMRGFIFHAPFEKLAHLSYINIKLGDITREELIRIKDILLASTQFKRCYLYQENVIDSSLLENFNKKVFPIPGSKDSMRILVDYILQFQDITIKRIPYK